MQPVCLSVSHLCAFLHMAPYAWRDLPELICKAPTVSVFKSHFCPVAMYIVLCCLQQILLIYIENPFCCSPSLSFACLFILTMWAPRGRHSPSLYAWKAPGTLWALLKINNLVWWIGSSTSQQTELEYRPAQTIRTDTQGKLGQVAKGLHSS